MVHRLPSIVLKTDKVAKQHKAKDQSEEPSFFHDFEGIWKMWPVFKNASKIDLELEKAVDIPSLSPKIEDQEPNSPEHGKYVCHRVDVTIILVEFQDIKHKNKAQSDEKEDG